MKRGQPIFSKAYGMLQLYFDTLFFTIRNRFSSRLLIPCLFGPPLVLILLLLKAPIP